MLEISGWGLFLGAMAGASATLAGLIFVGVSINLESIVSPEYPTMPTRALEALLALMGTLILATTLLIPGQPRWLVGGEVLVIGLIEWACLTIILVRDYPRTDRDYMYAYWLRVPFAQLAALCVIAAGAMILAGSWNGLYFIAPTSLLTYVLALFDGWVLLIEISR